MKSWRVAERPQSSSLIAAAAFLLVAAVSWAFLISTSHMTMDTPPRVSIGGGAVFVGMWAAMMAAMMLPSAIPMFLLYDTVARKLRANGERAIPQWLFAAAYLTVWAIAGVPVYALNAATAYAISRSPRFEEAVPYLVGVLLLLAGAYQFSPLKRACLGKCKSPLQFLTERWRSGYVATFRIAIEHAVYCLGCCAALMAILVGAGSMNLLWVSIITVAVFAEKILRQGEVIARVTGAVLIILGAAVLLNPALEQSMRRMPGALAPSSDAMQ